MNSNPCAGALLPGPLIVRCTRSRSAVRGAVFSVLVSWEWADPSRLRRRTIVSTNVYSMTSTSIATPDDIASLAVFLLSSESSQITGQTLHVNGGKFLF